MRRSLLPRLFHRRIPGRYHRLSKVSCANQTVSGAISVAPSAIAVARRVACQAASPVKTLDVAAVTRAGDEVHLVFEARSFLHRQVRSMTGSLVQVGLGRWRPDDLAAALAARDRQACGPVAPSDGLYLTGVRY